MVHTTSPIIHPLVQTRLHVHRTPLENREGGSVAATPLCGFKPYTVPEQPANSAKFSRFNFGACITCVDDFPGGRVCTQSANHFRTEPTHTLVLGQETRETGGGRGNVPADFDRNRGLHLNCGKHGAPFDLSGRSVEPNHTTICAWTAVLVCAGKG